MRHYRIHDVGTCVEQKNRYVKVKIGRNTWEGLGRHLLRNADIPIGEGDRVFFADGDRTNRHPSNLRRIHFNNTPVVFLSTSRVIPTPRGVSVTPPAKQHHKTRELVAA